MIQRLGREQSAIPKQNVDAKPANTETHRRLIPAQIPLHNAEWESSAFQTRPPAEAVAIVNGEVISYRDLVRWGSPLKELDGAVNLLLLKQAAKNAKLDIGSKEIDAEVLQRASKFKLPIDQWYSMLEKERGISRDHYRDLVTFPMLVLRRLAGDDTKQQLAFLAGLRATAEIELVDPDAKLLPVSAEATEPAPTTSVPDDEKPSE